MTAWLANALENIMDFSNILNASIAASWMVLAVIVLRFLLKKALKWTHVALWGLVAIRLILPFSIESAFSLIPSTQTIPQEVLRYEGTQLLEPAHLDVISNPIYSSDVSIELGKSVDRIQLRMVNMTYVWLAGITILILYTAISYWRLRRKVDTAVLYKDGIFQSENVISPFVLGVIKPRIYLPFSMNDQDLEHVVAHEQAHIHRKDHWWKPLGFLLLTIHWFNPLMWLAYVLLCRDIELACDEKVIKELGNEQRADYTQALVACSVNRRMIAACPLAFGEVGVKERVKSVMNYKKPAFWIIILSVIACMVVAVCFLTNPRQDKYALRIVVPAGSTEEIVYQEDFFYSDEEISPTGNSITISSGEGLGDTEVVLKPIEVKEENAYEPTYLTPGMPVEMDVEKGAWFKVGVNIQNPTDKDIIVYVEVEGVEVRIEDEVNSVIEWFDYTETPEEMPGDGRLEINLPEFPGVTFRWYPGKIEAVTEEEIVPLFHGMPIWNTYFCDLTGDGIPDICSTYTFGSGIIDSRIIIYDYANGASYELSDRGNFDFVLRFNEADGYLYVDKTKYNTDELVESGRLVFEDDCLQVEGFSSNTDKSTETWDLIPMVMVNGTLYLDTGHESNVEARCGVMDGEITSQVDGSKQPTVDDQSNFGTGYGYQYGATEGTIELFMNGKWWIFATEEARQEIQFPSTENEPSKFYLTIGAEGVKSIELSMPNSSGGFVNADGSLLKKGERIWLENLDGYSDLRGLTITALSENGEIIWTASIPDGEENKGFTHLVNDDWEITTVE